jgi:hypothetical protein
MRNIDSEVASHEQTYTSRRSCRVPPALCLVFRSRVCHRSQQHEYTFPLITPGLAHPLHLFFVKLTRDYLECDKPFRHRDNIDEGWQGHDDVSEEDGLERYFRLPRTACIDINSMTTSMEVPEGVQNIKVTIVTQQNWAFRRIFKSRALVSTLSTCPSSNGWLCTGDSGHSKLCWMCSFSGRLSRPPRCRRRKR